MVKVASILACILMISSIIPLGCSEERDPDMEVREIVSQTISAAEGGTITVTEEDSLMLEGLQLYIPPGALDSDQEITVSEILGGDLPALPEEYYSVGCQFFLQPEGLSFNSPVTIRIALPATMWHAWRDWVSPEDLTLIKYDSSSGDWLYLPTQIDHTGLVTAETSSFCLIIFVGRDPRSIVTEPRQYVSETRKKVEQQARSWLPDADESDLNDRLDSRPAFVNDEATTFADAIGGLLLAEEMWEKLRDGNYKAAASVAAVAVEALPEEVIMHGLFHVMGVSTPISALFTFASVSFKYALSRWRTNFLNEQIRRYLSWRGWFYDPDDGWTYKRKYTRNAKDWPLARDHAAVMRNPSKLHPLMWDPRGARSAWQEPDGTVKRAFAGWGMPDDINLHEALDEIGPVLYGLLHKVDEGSLAQDRAWLSKWFAGDYDHPRIEIHAPHTAIVEQEVTLGAIITVGRVPDEITIRDGETDDLARPVVWEWRQTAGPQISLDSESLMQTFIPSDPGDYVFELEARDTLWENHGSASVVITVWEEQQAVYFPDPNLEAAIREAIEKPTGDIYPMDLEGLTELDASGRSVANLTGLEHCRNLIELDLWGNQITDLSPISDLTRLAELAVGPNKIDDLSPLANLTGLTYLCVEQNKISDIRPLANLTNLESLCLGDNQIEDITPLVGLTSLEGLYLPNNQIRDISALVNNPGLGDGDIVWIFSNPLSATSINTYIPQLRQRGVLVDYLD